MRTRTMIPIAALLLAAPVSLSAAPRAGDWTPWYGCWRAETVAEEAGPLVCVLPGDAPMAVRIATIEDGNITEETVLRADGVARPIEEGGCSGTERAFFSSDGRRVFTRAELACTGLGRTSTGVLALVSPGEWVDVQALTVNGQHAARTIRYHAASPSEIPEWAAAALPQDQRLAQEAARIDASTPLDEAAVIEASQNVAAPAVEALLAASATGFRLDARKLVQLQQQGVPASTIDVMIALSHPERFAVAPRDPSMQVEEIDDGLRRERAARAERCFDPFWARYSMDCYGYGYYGYGYSSRRYGYSPYGYDPFGWSYSNRPIIVIVDPNGDERSGGAVVKGRGYTRGGTATGTATRREDRSSPSPARSTSSTRPSSSATPSSSSGSSSSQPRKAKPRGGGN
ncbi:MAG TPA: hypothetical protein VFZ69_14565 [Longimicrobiales bacterium]